MKKIRCALDRLTVIVKIIALVTIVDSKLYVLPYRSALHNTYDRAGLWDVNELDETKAEKFLNLDRKRWFQLLKCLIGFEVFRSEV
jgi:hypothetical protein